MHFILRCFRDVYKLKNMLQIKEWEYVIPFIYKAYTDIQFTFHVNILWNGLFIVARPASLNRIFVLTMKTFSLSQLKRNTNSDIVRIYYHLHEDEHWQTKNCPGEYLPTFRILRICGKSVPSNPPEGRATEQQSPTGPIKTEQGDWQQSKDCLKNMGRPSSWPQEEVDNK